MCMLEAEGERGLLSSNFFKAFALVLRESSS